MPPEVSSARAVVRHASPPTTVDAERNIVLMSYLVRLRGA